MIARDTLYSGNGGDTVQIEKTAQYLRNLDVEVDIKLTSEIIDYNKYDLLHFFNIIRPSDILGHLSKSSKPFVVSSIYVDYSELEIKFQGGLIKLLHQTIGKDWIEYLKAVARWILKGDKIQSVSYLYLGHKRSIRKILKRTKMVLPNSHSEMERLSADYGIKPNYRVIPNAVDSKIYNGSKIQQSLRKTVICIGRIEIRKNQLSVIEAIKETNFDLVVIGKSSPNQILYFEKCMKAGESLGDRFKYIEHLEPKDIAIELSKAKVHVLASWFETTGLVNLEAAAMGCQIVLTDKGDTEEYFGDCAFYCDPNNVGSIKEAVELAMIEDKLQNFENTIHKNYSWSVTAKKTLEAYKEAII